MLHKVIIPLFAFILMGSLLVSPLIPFLDRELGKTMMLSSAEEEESGKMEELAKKFDETATYIKYFSELRHELANLDQEISFSGYLFPSSDFTLEILDPPPKHLV